MKPNITVKKIQSSLVKKASGDYDKAYDATSEKTEAKAEDEKPEVKASGDYDKGYAEGKEPKPEAKAEDASPEKVVPENKQSEDECKHCKGTGKMKKASSPELDKKEESEEDKKHETTPELDKKEEGKDDLKSDENESEDEENSIPKHAEAFDLDKIFGRQKVGMSTKTNEIHDFLNTQFAIHEFIPKM